jgi:hypothetical protein
MPTELRSEPWNKGKIVGQKAPFKLKDVWAIRQERTPNQFWTPEDVSPRGSRRSGRSA